LTAIFALAKAASRRDASVPANSFIPRLAGATPRNGSILFFL
jgi:hypothetical protein